VKILRAQHDAEGLSCMRGRPPRVGWGSISTSAGRSTSCTRWRASCSRVSLGCATLGTWQLV
jgi:hypothetical protein